MDLLLIGEKGVLDLDCIYFDVKEWLLLVVEDCCQVVIRQQGFDDVVVWNFGFECCVKLVDMLFEGWFEMLCVEVVSIGCLIELQFGESWVGWQGLSLF